MKLKDNFSIFHMISLPHVLTLMNISSGVMSLFFSAAGKYTLACSFILAAVFFDGIDGKVARYMNRTTLLGKELDSLCDVVSFGVAPAFLAFQTTKALFSGWLSYLVIAVYILFVCAGALRLARFNIKNIDYFEGMPITINGVIVPLLYFMGLVEVYPIALAISAVLMISAFRIKKL